jgi:hypothetical protein
LAYAIASVVDVMRSHPAASVIFFFFFVKAEETGCSVFFDKLTKLFRSSNLTLRYVHGCWRSCGRSSAAGQTCKKVEKIKIDI